MAPVVPAVADSVDLAVAPLEAVEPVVDGDRYAFVDDILCVVPLICYA